jgi:hypothetical protein
MRTILIGLLFAVGGCGDSTPTSDGPTQQDLSGARDLSGATDQSMTNQDLSAAGDQAMSGQDMSMSGGDMSMSGGDMSMSGGDMTKSGGDMSMSGGDMTKSGGDMTALCCGQPGDVGNNLGVGKYCADFGGCANNGSASLCASLGDPNLHFCTFLCTKGTTNCGTGASCQCNPQNPAQCACFPDSCANMPASC